MSMHPHQIPPNIANRLRSCRKRIQQKLVNGYLITNWADQFYMTGFNGTDGAALILPRQVYLLTDGRFEEEAEVSTPWARSVIRQGPLPETLAKIVKRHRIQRLGFQPEYLTVGTLAKLRRVLRPARMVALPSVVGQLRLIKDDSEVTAIKKAIRVAESAFRAVLRRIRLGITERQLAALLQHEMLDRGAEEASFPIIVAAGANSSRPHAQP
ncbi:MAG: aminopeptidase P family protein, partial [Planctomycetota bacterium]